MQNKLLSVSHPVSNLLQFTLKRTKCKRGGFVVWGVLSAGVNFTHADSIGQCAQLLGKHTPLFHAL